MSQGPRLRARLAGIARQIGALEAQIAVLRDEQEKVEEGLKTLVYPILTLPNQVTSEIFIQYVDVGAKFMENPMTLTRVCWSWRKVAVCTPRLWIYFQRHSVKLLPLWLSRSGSLPFSLEMLSFGMKHRRHGELYRIISKYSSRCEMLDLILDHPPPSSELSRSFPRLKSFRFSAFCNKTTTIPVLHHAPSLRHVRLSGLSFENWQTALPWAQLTKLVINADLDVCREVVRCTSSLEDLEISADDTGSLLPSTPVFLPRLQRLSLPASPSTMYGEGYCGFEILRHLVLPGLQDLSIWLGETDEDELDVVEALFERSQCYPRRLFLTVMHADDELINQFFGGAPLDFIQELTLCGPFSVEDGLNDLLALLSTKRQIILPSLEHLVIDECDIAVDVTLLVSMLASRTRTRPQGVKKLESFRMFFCEEGNAPVGAHPHRIPDESTINNALQQLRRLASEGLEIDMRGPKWFSRNIDSAMIREIDQCIGPRSSNKWT
ncbi:hypothetical protein FB45DRAFT_898113 [Roridomyces roridus]|uniref:F-box domain-containing protein n=1 Tax=Roridomyces roridus TaxID=1738132 RepID=A0AAD7FV43_9AGAR|nr:hypothetical protein FB45DRAFT_898113 [Roridomyces roridus]